MRLSLFARYRRRSIESSNFLEQSRRVTSHALASLTHVPNSEVALQRSISTSYNVVQCLPTLIMKQVNMNSSCRCERGLTVSVLTAAQLRARRWAALEAAPHQSGKRSTGKAISDRRVPFDVDVVDSMITTYRTEGRPSWLQPKKDNRSAAQAPDNKSRSLIWSRC